VAQARAQSAGRPGPALLILGAIFATALFLRVPIGPAPAEEIASAIDSTNLSIWSASPIASMDRPSIDALSVSQRRAIAPVVRLEPLEMAPLSRVGVVAPGEVIPRRAGAIEPPMAVAEPALASIAHSHMTGLATPVTRVAYVESPSRPFGAVGTAFVKTGAALTLAFKKTGQGILAPF
jgi:hypothetical protein